MEELGALGETMYVNGTVQAGCKMFLLHYPTNGTPDSVTIYDFERDVWHVEQVPGLRSHSTMVALQDKVYFAGGRQLEEPESPFIHARQDSNLIDIYNLFPVVRTLVNNQTTSQYSFDKVEISKTHTLNLQLINDGDYDLVLADSPFTLSGDGSFTIGSFSSGDTLAPADTVHLPVLFKPTETGSYEAELTITSNDPDNPVYTFTIEGTADKPTAVKSVEPAKTLDIFPNPTTGLVQVRYKRSVNCSGSEWPGSGSKRNNCA